MDRGGYEGRGEMTGHLNHSCKKILNSRGSSVLPEAERLPIGKFTVAMNVVDAAALAADQATKLPHSTHHGKNGGVWWPGQRPGPPCPLRSLQP